MLDRAPEYVQWLWHATSIPPQIGIGMVIGITISIIVVKGNKIIPKRLRLYKELKMIRIWEDLVRDVSNRRQYGTPVRALLRRDKRFMSLEMALPHAIRDAFNLTPISTKGLLPGQMMPRIVSDEELLMMIEEFLKAKESRLRMRVG